MSHLQFHVLGSTNNDSLQLEFVSKRHQRCKTLELYGLVHLRHLANK